MRSSGLRESKKAATRLALAEAVLTLATRDGIDAVTIDAVAAEVGVSVRTFHNYFTSKEDALIAFVGVLLDRIDDGVRARPEGESLWDSLRFAMTEIATDSDTDPEALVTLLRLFDTEPALAAHSRSIDLGASIDTRLSAMMAARGADPETLHPHLAFTTALCAARTALEFWSAHRDTVHHSAREMLDAAFDQLGAGMAQQLPITSPSLSNN
ncbi:TetR/AcrR family transcriptional regulator [Gordonia polyisoprenivorans]|uniref:TetR/AcrR family transcriptional regulator n=1 Tax=Gordonia polyisoprenivorans TaxID=84595 RepID=UPI0022FFE6C8|nr:TetR/AcrR family transcriptional regulator [Gordonia polyisoprenivorans]WCB39009.1 TetR/AcrR family transcriptional regulator [Gordonia polyisoprenivorans]